MKLFQVTQIYLEGLGFSRHLTRLNRYHVIGFIVSFTGIVSSIIFVIHVAETVKEFTDSLYIASVIICAVSGYAITIYKTRELFAYFDEYDENVTTSRSKYWKALPNMIRFILLNFNLPNVGITNVPTSNSVYQDCNELVEKLCKILYILFVNISAPGFIMPKIVLSFFLYFTTDSGADAFDLPLPMWLEKIFF